MSDSSVSLVGNLTREPELKYLPSGTASAQFGLAVNLRRRNGQSQEWEERTSFFDVVCYGSLGENVSESLGKGCRVVVTGRLEQRSWENDQGEKRSKVEVVADEVGPSLRWATCDVTRNERREGQPARTGGGSGGGGRRPAPEYSDEEPFVSLRPDDLWRVF